jgi:ribosomal protein L12E/L44/L45/RPP1/RPP2
MTSSAIHGQPHLHAACSALGRGAGVRLHSVVAHAGLKDARLSSSRRLQQLVELDLEDGWSVAPTAPSNAAPVATTNAAAAKPAKAGKAAADTTAGADEQQSKRRTGRKKVMLSGNPLAGAASTH